MDIALLGGRVIDGNGGPPLDDACLLVRGREILTVGPRATTAIPDGAITYDVSGRTVLPGLIDGHVHLRAYAGADRSDFYLWSQATFYEEQILHAARNARRALEAGVTTVRDAAGARLEVAIKHATDQQLLDGARVVVCGFVGMTGGHGDLFTPPAVDRRPYQTADGPDECRKLVRSYARDGVDWIKICTSGGVLSIGDESDWRNYTLDEVRTIVDEAHALGKRVAAHAHTLDGVRQALDGGVDSIEHGSSLDADLIRRMIDQGTWLCPTLSVSEQIHLSGAERGLPPAALHKNALVRASRTEAHRAAVAAGVRIFMGTDTSSILPFGRHAWELELLSTLLGVEPMRALQIATRDAATALGLGERTGVLAAGRWADILVVDGDPLADIRILQRPECIQAVFRDGRLLVDRGLRSARATLS
ncbi:MAG: amidohydrolase family protein [Chloroflexi bacterium]|nr:amidohydrolase family protein [Chloroflexota bacterium]MBV9133705.1 amidohydrolase family protein [Chloroflexota bacterium]MBV9896528.1 amidohydrolase family protein [Chloroflexota bacterium]